LNALQTQNYKLTRYKDKIAGQDSGLSREIVEMGLVKLSRHQEKARKGRYLALYKQATDVVVV